MSSTLSTPKLPPHAVIMIPGLGGSILHGKDLVTGETEMIWPRIRHGNQVMSKYYKATLDPDTFELIPVDKTKIIFAPDDNFGIYSIDYLTPDVPLPHDTRSYYHDMIQMFLAYGYVPGISLFGYPYDWRQCVAADSIMNPLRTRIRQAFHACGNQKVDIITHSMGALVFRSFVQLFPDENEKFVRRWIAIAPPFQGGTHVLRALLFGYNLGLPKFVISPHLMQLMEQVIMLPFWFMTPIEIPYSPKLIVKYRDKDDLTFYGFHNQTDGTCMDCEAVHTLEEEEAMFEHIWGDPLFPSQIKDKLIFSTELREKLKMRNGEGDDVHLLTHSDRVYYRCKCGESFYVENGHATIPPSFSPSFLQNRANPAFWAYSDATLDGRDLQASERYLTNPIFRPFPTTQMMSPNHPPPQPRHSLHVFPDESGNAFYPFATQKQDPPPKGTHTHDFKRVALLPFVESEDAGESSLKSRILAGVFDVLSTTEYRLRRESDKKARDRFQESWQKALERSDELGFAKSDDEFDLMLFGRDDRREARGEDTPSVPLVEESVCGANELEAPDSLPSPSAELTFVGSETENPLLPDLPSFGSIATKPTVSAKHYETSQTPPNTVHSCFTTPNQNSATSTPSTPHTQDSSTPPSSRRTSSPIQTPHNPSPPSAASVSPPHPPSTSLPAELIVDSNIDTRLFPAPHSGALSAHALFREIYGSTLWKRPSLSQYLARVESIRGLPVIVPDAGQFEFVSIYGSGLPTSWDCVVIDEGKEGGEGNKVCGPTDLVEEGIPHPVWTVVDGDRTVPTFCAVNDGMRADARFELKGALHVDILWDRRCLNIVAGVMGLPLPFVSVKKDRVEEKKKGFFEIGALPAKISTQRALKKTLRKTKDVPFAFAQPSSGFGFPEAEQMEGEDRREGRREGREGNTANPALLPQPSPQPEKKSSVSLFGQLKLRVRRKKTEEKKEEGEGGKGGARAERMEGVDGETEDSDTDSGEQFGRESAFATVELRRGEREEEKEKEERDKHAEHGSCAESPNTQPSTATPCARDQPWE
ncbi:putative lecithin:cholesterol acyltransferase family protein [Blattamonas nauphoetae]|uniref:Lecithin:cholesterol acyltransferase family protein n=1 Tax=Blattamonas nauphoetae TaxID=2049346 RepID=A0ABQ9YJ94_9EUKA|nr:putative lecithin:cholesterol acyltransferase family protein [Blattamonas nauphoetae]